MSRESYIRGFCKAASAHGMNPQSLANYVYASEMLKAANFVSDWLTKKYSQQSDDFRKSLGLKPIDRSRPAPTTGVFATPKLNPLANAAKKVSDSYPKGTPWKPKFVTGGKVVVK